ncbi:MAG: hypothetical protein ACOYMA_08490 [Bacteroidia bacterium]
MHHCKGVSLISHLSIPNYYFTNTKSNTLSSPFLISRSLIIKSAYPCFDALRVYFPASKSSKSNTPCSLLTTTKFSSINYNNTSANSWFSVSVIANLTLTVPFSKPVLAVLPYPPH